MATRNRPFTLVELDIPVCSLTYGTAPCTASVPGTGAQKCFNTIRTCQDTGHFSRSFQTLRVCMPSEDIPLEYDALPNLSSVNVTPCVIDPGNSIGQRATVKVSCVEHPSADSLFDKYLADRAYIPFKQGTFWARLRARVPSLQGIPLRVLRGQFGEPLSTYLTEHYIVEGGTIDADGIDISAKDALAFCDPSKAQCPVLSTGRLLAGILEADLSAMLTPAGIGDLEYPASGYGCLSGKEVVSFTRVADVLTIVRNQFGTRIQDHSADSIFQLVQVYDGESVADIVYSLLVTFTPGIDASWCDLPAWESEADTYVGHLYHAVIPAPTSVKVLLDEMMAQAGCALWWDPVAQQVKFQTLRPVATSAFIYDDDRIKMGSFKAQEQPDKRISLAATYYGLADPTNKVDKEANFRAAVARPVDAAATLEYDVPALKTNLARWINIDNRPAAERLNAMQLSRYRDAPRRATMALDADCLQLPGLGKGILVQSFSLQEADGSASTVPFYVVSRDDEPDQVLFELEEMRFTEVTDETDRAVFIDVDHFNVNLRNLYDTLYSSVPAGATITFTVAPSAYVGGQVLASPSLDVGTWPVDTIVILVIGTLAGAAAGVLGRGGNAGGYPGLSSTGEAGSTALYTRRALILRNYGTIGGGGGGGQGRVGFFPGDGVFYAAGGGGGAGYNGIAPLAGRIGGTGGQQGGQDGTVTAGGEPGTSPPGPGGDGGDLGASGHDYNGAPGHSAAGVAIDGVSFVILDVPGTILGATIN